MLLLQRRTQHLSPGVADHVKHSAWKSPALCWLNSCSTSAQTLGHGSPCPGAPRARASMAEKLVQVVLQSIYRMHLLFPPFTHLNDMLSWKCIYGHFQFFMCHFMLQKMFRVWPAMSLDVTVWRCEYKKDNCWLSPVTRLGYNVSFPPLWKQ